MSPELATVDQMVLSYIEEALTDAESVNPRDLAAMVFERLVEECPDTLNGWLMGKARELLVSYIYDAFPDEPKKPSLSLASPDFVPVAQVSLMDAVHQVGDEQKALRDMTGADLRVVAENYQATAERQAMLAAFFRVLAKTARNKKLGEVMDERRVREVYEQLAGVDVIEVPALEPA